MFLCAALLLAAAVPCATEILIEAEDMTVKRGWKVEAGAQFNGQPNLWSAARLTADETDAPAEAFTDIAVPRPGMYRLWVHYESCYGFGSVFSVEVEQRGRRQRAVFGRKTAEKYFPFGRGWAVQGPWDWHNTDYVYEYADFDLQRGPARVWLTKGENEQPPALRVVDFLLLTTDLSGEPGDDWQWQSLLTHFTIPLRLRVECVASDKRVLPVVRPRLWLIGYYKGPMVDYYIARKRLVAVKDGPPPEEEWLGSGQRTEWLTINVHKAMPAWITFAGNSGAHLRVSLDYLVSGRRVSRTVDWRGPSLELICPVGNERYEADLTGRARIITMDELVEDRRRQAESYSPPGRRPRRIFVRTGLVDQPDFIRLGAAMGINAQAYGISAKIYAKEAPDLGFIKSRAFTSVQNWFITKQCLEGDFSALEDALRKLHARHVEDGVAHVPVTFKLIEEAGPPGLETLRTWPKINERFREYLRSEGVSPEEVLPKDITQQLGLSLPAMGQEPIWEKVELGSGSPEEAKSNPALFYHSHRFRAVLFADTAARTVRLLEEIWGPQTRADSGSFYPSTGQGPVLDRGIEPFELFRRRGATWYSSEISWGWGGTPDFVGPQVASYEAALARSLAKYHQCPLGTYIISDPNRGYNGDFLERYAYTLISQGFTDLHFYVLAYPTECSFLSSTDVHKAIKRISYTAGALEDKLAGAEVVPAQVAIAWSATTDVWDLAHEPSGRWEVSNNIYPQERLLDYLLLRHAQVPADIISEQDFEDGYLDRYNVLFLVGDHLRRSAADKLRAWLRRGGVLIALAGGGLRDEYDRPVPEMLEVYGLRGEDLEKRQWCMRPKLELVHAAPIDRLRCSWRGASVAIDAYAFRHRLDPLPETQVIGRFSNGEAGAVVNRYGDGVAMLFGVLPGLAYVKPAIPTLPYGRGGTRELSRFIPTAYDAQIRDFMWHLLGGLGIQRPIVCSDPLVEPVLLKSGQGHYVAFVNHAPGQPRRLRCTVALPDQWQAQEIWPDQRPLGAGHEIDLGVMRTKFVLIELRTAQGH